MFDEFDQSKGFPFLMYPRDWENLISGRKVTLEELGVAQLVLHHLHGFDNNKRNCSHGFISKLNYEEIARYIYATCDIPGVEDEDAKITKCIQLIESLISKGVLVIAKDSTIYFSAPVSSIKVFSEEGYMMVPEYE